MEDAFFLFLSYTLAMTQHAGHLLFLQFFRQDASVAIMWVDLQLPSKDVS